ncbi:hypothetical protein [Nocardia gipuzkoensis]|uniref:hypothetical protein n=1 Tax=Nocardia gipuzkoensis TaxID=2749991 RepID=UPI00237E15FF|nr:hypothetical protein [Nocardia gipuzkoensis]MDE1672656.1 hypothetical protein [Nocardia gipuzkoensis]
MTDPTSSAATPSGTSVPGGGRGSGGAPSGLWQRLAYLLVVLAMHRAAKQIREIKEAESRIRDGDEQALTRHAERVSSARSAAEQRLTTLNFGMPREDIAAALVDAITWAESSPVAAKALEELTGFYELHYGLKISPSGRTLEVDPDYPATSMQAGVEEAASFYREKAAAAAVSTLVAATPLPAPAQAQIADVVTAWVGNTAEPAALTPQAIQQRRNELEIRLQATDLSAHDRAESLFLIDYLTGNAAKSGVDLLDTSVLHLTAPAPAPSTPRSDDQPLASTTVPAPEQRTVSDSNPHQPANPADAAAQPAPSNGHHTPGAGDFGEGGGYPVSPTPPPATSYPPADDRPAPLPPTGARPADHLPPVPLDTAEPPVAPRAAPGVDREQTTRLLSDYAEDVKKAYRLADELAVDTNMVISDDMHQLTDRLRTQRHQLDAIADHGPGLAEVERTQIRAVLYDIDAGKTSLPALLWVDEPYKRAADENLHRQRGQQIATSAVTAVTETLDNAGALAQPSGSKRLPDALRAPLDTLLTSLRPDTGPLQQRRDAYTAAADQLGHHLTSLGVDEDTRRRVDDFVRFDMPNERYARRPDRVVNHLTGLLDHTGVLQPAQNSRSVDVEVVSKSMRNLSEIIGTVASGSGNRDQLRRRYRTAMDNLGRHLLDAGVDDTTRQAVRAIIDDRARAASEHAITGRQRRSKWAERNLPRTGSQPATSTAAPNQPGGASPPSTAAPPQRPSTQRPRRKTYSPFQRRKQLRQQHFRADPGARTSTRV